MKSHAKASPVGSNSDRGASCRSLRRSGPLAALLVALMAAACLLPGSASAIEFRSKTGEFGPDGTSGTSFSYSTALAFDQGSKRLYSLDQPGHKIYAFDASTPGTHTPVGGSFPLSVPGSGELDDLAVDSSLHHLLYANKGGNKVYGFDESGAALSGFPITQQALGSEPLDRPCGVTVEPASGKILVASRGSQSIYRYGPTGNSLDLFGSRLFSDHPCRIALDSNENLYIAEFFGATVEYTAASHYSESKLIDPELTFGLTVDQSTNEVYVLHFEYVSVYDETGALLYEFGFGGEYGGEFSGIALDEATGELFVSHGEKIDVFGPPLSLPKVNAENASGITTTGATVHGTVNPRGLALEECHFEVVPTSQFVESKYANVTSGEKYPCVPAPGSIPADSEPHAVSAAVTGLQPASIYHFRLVAKNSIGEAASNIDRQLTTGPTAPLIEAQSVEVVGTNEATVAAKVNPRGGETTYHVEYGTTNVYGQSTSESAPLGFASDTSSHTVSVHIGGLQPGTAYHFRFVAANGVGTTAGVDSTFATYSATAPTFAPCANDLFRTGLGARLPDCRAYEQATPTEKHGGGIEVTTGVNGVSASGDRFSFFADGGLPVSGGFSSLAPFIASRGPGGWSTDGFLPLGEPGALAITLGVSEDFSTALVKGDVSAGQQLFLRDSDTGTFEPGPTATKFNELSPVGFAKDSHHIAFLTTTQLLPEAPAGKSNVYDLDHGALTLADRIPAGSATSCDDEAGPACQVPAEGTDYGQASARILPGGSVVFTANPSGSAENTGRVYLREGGARTIWISASQRATPDPNGEKPAQLVGITSDGSKVLFKSCEKLTDDSTAVSTAANSCQTGFTPIQGQDLYSYDVETGGLTDLTVDSSAGDPLGAAVQEVLGASEDGSYVYFFGEGVLAPGATHGECLTFSGECNLYVYHGGATRFIAHIHPQGESRVSADGSTLVFSSTRSLTGYNNAPAAGSVCPGNNPCAEFFRYSAPEEELLCVTCLPTGLPPSFRPSLGGSSGGEFAYDGSAGGPIRNLSADGNRFFFNSPDAMVPADTNGKRKTDVYEWEAKGEGSCESESQDGGCIYLISGGTTSGESGFVGASKDGDHVFLATEQQLVPSDEDHNYDIYDAGTGAGLASQHTLAPPSCASTACQANPAPPPDLNTASAAYAGAGNVHQATANRRCPKGTRKVRRSGKVRCQKAHKQHKRHHNRGGSK